MVGTGAPPVPCSDYEGNACVFAFDVDATGGRLVANGGGCDIWSYNPNNPPADYSFGLGWTDHFFAGSTDYGAQVMIYNSSYQAWFLAGGTSSYSNGDFEYHMQQMYYF